MEEADRGHEGPRGESENGYLCITGLKTFWSVGYKDQDFHHAIETPLNIIQLKCGPIGQIDASQARVVMSCVN